MPDALATLEADRSKLLEEFLRLGDLRNGSITATVRKCGKPSCHCAKPKDPGHDPQFRLSAKWTEKLSTSPFPLRPHYAKRNGRLTSSVVSISSTTSRSASTKRSAIFAP
jgi:hypothetical protein